MAPTTTSTPTTSTEDQSRSRTAFRRYVIVTAIATPANLILYATVLRVTHLHPTICNAIAASVLTPPTFAALRLWAWQRAGRTHGQLVAYWLTTVVNVVAASAVVWIVTRVGAPQTAIVVTPLLVYTAMWAGRYLLLDRLLFVVRR